VTNALAEKLKAIRDEELRQDLIKGYIKTREEDRLINQEWEAVTLEGWP